MSVTPPVLVMAFDAMTPPYQTSHEMSTQLSLPYLGERDIDREKEGEYAEIEGRTVVP
jgi:hypothetical protein